MLIDSLLEPYENLICSWGTLHATEKRIVRLETGKIGYQLNDLLYNKIERISTTTSRRKSTIVLGMLVALMGFLLFPTGAMETVFILTGLFSVIGAVFGIGRSRMLKIYSQDFDSSKKTIWEFQDFDTPEMRHLCLTLGSMVSKLGGEVFADQSILREITPPDLS